MTDGPSAPSTTVSPDPAGVASRPPSSGAQPILPLALTALAVSLLAGATATAALLALHDLIGPDASTLALLIMGALALAAWAPAWPAVSALLAGRRRAALVLEHDVVRARHTAATGRESARTSMGYALAVLVVAGLIFFATANDGSRGPHVPARGVHLPCLGRCGEGVLGQREGRRRRRDPRPGPRSGRRRHAHAARPRRADPCGPWRSPTWTYSVPSRASSCSTSWGSACPWPRSP